MSDNTIADLDMGDRFDVHSYFMLGFTCESCHRWMQVVSDNQEYADPGWYIDQARQARAERWYVPPLTDEDPWALCVWCSDCATKLGICDARAADHT